MRKIMYKNLCAEMARNDLTITKISKELKINRNTLSKKLAGASRLYLDEATAIRDTFFPNQDIRYLFASDELN